MEYLEPGRFFIVEKFFEKMKETIVTIRKAGAHRNANDEYCSQILSPSLGDIVDSGSIECSYRPARLSRLACQYDISRPESTISPGQRLIYWLLG